MAGEQPRVLMLLSVISEVEDDVDGPLETHAGVYQINKREVRLSNPDAVAKALAVQPGDADLVAVVGGGGEWLSVLSDRRVIDTVVHVPIPIVSAVGHTGRHPLIEQVVHRAFPTPTLFGIWLAARATAAIPAVVSAPTGEPDVLRQHLEQSEAALQHTQAQLRRQGRRDRIVIAAVVALVIILVVRWALS
jgi:Exonuclease VII, large subunit